MTERITTPEAHNNDLPDIPKSKEIYAGDINAAVITVQQITGYEITPEWWAQHVGNEGSTESILERFDAAFERFVYEQKAGRSIDDQTDEQQILDEATEAYDAFTERFKNDPDYDALNQEFLAALREHLMNKYDASEGGGMDETEQSFDIAIEVSDEYDQDERLVLTDSTRRALVKVDEYLEGATQDIFGGMTIAIGEDLTQSGGEALSDKNKVLLSGRRMMMSLNDMRGPAGYSDDELTGGTLDENEPGSALEYVLVHEMGHMLDETTEAGNEKHRVVAAESPTAYGRDADEWNNEKDHEAFAEGFAHMVYGMPVSAALAEALQQTIRAKLAQEKSLESIPNPPILTKNHPSFGQD